MSQLELFPSEDNQANKPVESGVMSYGKAVAVNLTHMGTLAHEWAALPILGIAEKDGHSFPMYSFPDGYGSAPSLFKSSSSDMCCELCGHSIKKAYYLQHDGKKWLLMVGSECVTHFSGTEESGERLAKQAQWDINRQLLRETISLYFSIRDKFSRVVDIGYGRRERRWKINSAYTAFRELDKMTKGRQPDEERSCPADSDAVVTKWAKRHGERAKELMAHWGPQVTN